MEFRVLGQLEVRDGDRVLDIGRGKQSALLALLLLHPDHALSADRLIDELWGERPPATARKTLQVHVLRLRKALGPGIIVTRPPTYAVELEGHDLDLHHFERLLAEGRDALAAGDADRAATLLKDALVLWRGPPLVDLGFEAFAQPEIARLDELRLAAVEEQIDAELVLGRHAEMVPELERLVARHPLRERLRGQHMLALYRSGRQADALDAYRAARAALVDELGIEPGPALRELHGRVLAQNPMLEAPPAVAAPPSGRGNLPQPATSFVGREQELEELGAIIERERLVTVHGPGGSGKTRLALRAAERAGGAWLVELAPIADPALVWPAVASVFGVQEEPGRTVAECVVTALASRAALVVLDNCEHVLDAARDVAAALLDGCPGLHLLLTAREPLGDPAERVWPIPELSLADDAIRLFAERGARSLPGYRLDDGDRAAVANICRQLDGLPLAIELAAARLNVLAPAQIAERLHDRFRLLSRGERGAPARHRTLRAAVDWSYALLSDDEQRALAQASVFAGGFDLDAAEAVLDGDALELVSALVEKSLFLRRDEQARARYGAHETIQQFAAEQLAARGDADELRARQLGWCVALLERADDGLRGPDRAAWLTRLAPDQDNFRQVLAWGLSHGEQAHALELAWHLYHFWGARGNLAESERWLGAALEATAAAPASIERTRALTRWGELAELRGDYDAARARHGQALAMGRALDDPVRQAVAELSLGQMDYAQGRFDDARRHLEESDALLRDAGDPERARWPAEALARLEIATGDTAQARRRLEATRDAARALGNEAGVGEATLWFAEAAHRDDELLAARELYTEALGLSLRGGDEDTIARCRLGLGRLDLDSGAPADAVPLLADALRFARDAGLRPLVPDCLDALAVAALAGGDPEMAASLIGAAAACRERLGTIALERDHRRAEAALAAARAALDGPRFASVHGAGRALGFGEAVERALAFAAAG
jgi:predicted ATPase/DNA-binding SARP family transcriptional activator